MVIIHRNRSEVKNCATSSRATLISWLFLWLPF